MGARDACWLHIVVRWPRSRCFEPPRCSLKMRPAWCGYRNRYLPGKPDQKKATHSWLRPGKAVSSLDKKTAIWARTTEEISDDATRRAMCGGEAAVSVHPLKERLALPPVLARPKPREPPFRWRIPYLWCAIRDPERPCGKSREDHNENHPGLLERTGDRWC